MEICHEYKARFIEPDFSAESKIMFSSLMRHMQQSGSDQLAAKGVTYESMKEKNAVFLMTHHELHMTQNPAMLGEFTITTWPRFCGGALFHRHYSISQRDKLLGECSTAWALVNPQTRRMLRPSLSPVPPIHCERTVSFGDPRRTKLPDDLPPLFNIEIGYNFLDINGHVNNSVYADFVVDSVKRLCPDACLTGQSIAFKGEALMGDRLFINAARHGEKIFIKGEIDKRPCFDAIAYTNGR